MPRLRASEFQGRGTYVLVLKLSHTRRLRVGMLGVLCFPTGYYLYVGSALSGLAARVGRHLRRREAHRWHIDYLREAASVGEVWWAESDQRMECAWAHALEESDPASQIKNFGASDCRCRSHLRYVGDYEGVASLKGVLEQELAACGRGNLMSLRPHAPKGR